MVPDAGFAARRIRSHCIPQYPGRKEMAHHTNTAAKNGYSLYHMSIHDTFNCLRGMNMSPGSDLPDPFRRTARRFGQVVDRHTQTPRGISKRHSRSGPEE